MVLAVAPQESFELKSSVDTVKKVERPAIPQHATENETQAGKLKSQLKSLLVKYEGSTKHPDVLKVIDQLAEINPSKENCMKLPSFEGEFCALTSPNFPGRIKNENGPSDLVQYTLGRLSFNIFQPNKLVCTLRTVRNRVDPTCIPGKEGLKTFTYDLICDITIHTPDGDLPATLVNKAVCYEDTKVNNRCMVSFSGGSLAPAEEVKADPEKLKLWSKTFEGAYSKAEGERSYAGKVFQFLLKLLLGLTLPSDDSVLEHTSHFEMKRAPHGYLDMLYQDDDVRITKGNRGTIVVVERCAPTVTSQ